MPLFKREDPEYGSVVSSITDKILASFGIKPEQVDKVKSIIDMIQITDKGTYQEIVIDLKKITIKIEK